jgi:hypothetical protein
MGKTILTCILLLDMSNEVREVNLSSSLGSDRIWFELRQSEVSFGSSQNDVGRKLNILAETSKVSKLNNSNLNPKEESVNLFPTKSRYTREFSCAIIRIEALSS